MITRTCYVLASTCPPQFAGGSDVETVSLLPDHGMLQLARQPVWSVVEQTGETGPGYGSVSERLIASGLTLDEAMQLCDRRPVSA